MNVSNGPVWKDLQRLRRVSTSFKHWVESECKRRTLAKWDKKDRRRYTVTFNTETKKFERERIDSESD